MSTTYGDYYINGQSGALRKRFAKTILTAAQVKALFTTPIQIAANPYTGHALIVERIVFASTFNANAYAGANNLEFRYTNGAGTKVSADISASTLNFGSGTKVSAVAGIDTELAVIMNAVIVVCVPVANPTTGDSLVTIVVDYYDLALP